MATSLIDALLTPTPGTPGMMGHDSYHASTNNTTAAQGAMGPPACPHPALPAPPSKVFLVGLSTSSIILLIVLVVFVFATLAIYVEEVIFIIRTFRISVRRKKTIWVLAFFPVFSICGFIGVLAPLTGPFVHMCANLFFSTCLYQLMRLIVDYMGGAKRIWTIVEKGRRFQMNTMPICCCCLCCPHPVLTRLNFFKITMMVLQVSIIRPIILFIASVLYIDKIYYTGQLSPWGPFIWIQLINLVSTCLAVYGLILLSKALSRELEKDFKVQGKIISIQGTLIMTVIPNIIIAGLLSSGKITCTTKLPAKAFGEVIYYCILVLIMLPFSLVGRKFFRRLSDSSGYAAGVQQPKPTAAAAPGPETSAMMVGGMEANGNGGCTDLMVAHSKAMEAAGYGRGVEAGESIV